MVIQSDLEQEETFLAPDYPSCDEGDDGSAPERGFEMPIITIAWLEERIAELEEANNAICSSRAEERQAAAS